MDSHVFYCTQQAARALMGTVHDGHMIVQYRKGGPIHRLSKGRGEPRLLCSPDFSREGLFLEGAAMLAPLENEIDRVVELSDNPRWLAHLAWINGDDALGKYVWRWKCGPILPRKQEGQCTAIKAAFRPIEPSSLLPSAKMEAVHASATTRSSIIERIASYCRSFPYLALGLHYNPQTHSLMVYHNPTERAWVATTLIQYNPSDGKVVAHPMASGVSYLLRAKGGGGSSLWRHWLSVHLLERRDLLAHTLPFHLYQRATKGELPEITGGLIFAAHSSAAAAPARLPLPFPFPPGKIRDRSLASGLSLRKALAPVTESREKG